MGRGEEEGWLGAPSLGSCFGQCRDLVLSFPTYQKELFSNALSALRVLEGLCAQVSSSSSKVRACLLCPLEPRNPC